MNILFCGDRNVQDGLLIAVFSLLENTQEHLDIYVLTLDMSMNGRIYSPIEQTFVDYLNETVSAQYDDRLYTYLENMILDGFLVIHVTNAGYISLTDVCLAPKPPPILGFVTRISEGDIPSACDIILLQ